MLLATILAQRVPRDQLELIRLNQTNAIRTGFSPLKSNQCHSHGFFDVATHVLTMR